MKKLSWTRVSLSPFLIFSVGGSREVVVEGVGDAIEGARRIAPSMPSHGPRGDSGLPIKIEPGSDGPEVFGVWLQR